MSFLMESLIFLDEARRFVTVGKAGKGKHDNVGIVLDRFYSIVPEFARSEEERQSRANGWTLRGAWPTSGKHLLDWEIETWGERGGDVIVKINLWDKKGLFDGISYRVNVATAGKVAVKFWRWFQQRKEEIKRGSR